MKLRTLLAAALLLAAIGIVGAAPSRHNNYDRDATLDQLRHVDTWTHDLAPALANQMRREGNRSNYIYSNSRGSEEIRAMMALGSFAGEAHAFHETWDRYPDAPLGAALSDLDRSFQSANQWMRLSRTNRDINQRWYNIRRAYDQFRALIDSSPAARSGSDTGYDQGYNPYNNSNDNDRSGYDRNGYDRNGYDRNGFDRNGYDRDGNYNPNYDANRSSEKRPHIEIHQGE